MYILLLILKKKKKKKKIKKKKKKTTVQQKCRYDQNEYAQQFIYLRHSWRTNNLPFSTNFHSGHSNVPTSYYFITTQSEFETRSLSSRVKLLIVVFQTPNIINGQLLNKQPLQHNQTP